MLPYTYLFEIFYRDRDPARPTVICHIVPPDELDGYMERYLKLERVASVGVAQVIVTKVVTYKSKELPS